MNIKSMQCTLLFLLLLAGCSADPKIEEPSQKPEKETESMTCKTYLDTMMTEKNLTRTDTEHLIWSRGGKSGDQFSIDLTKQRISVKDPEMTYGGKERPEDDYELGILTNEKRIFFIVISFLKIPSSRTEILKKILQLSIKNFRMS